MKPKSAPFQLTSHLIRNTELKIRDGFMNKKLKSDFDIDPSYEIFEVDKAYKSKLKLDIKFNLKSGRKIYIGFKTEIIGTFLSPKKVGKDDFISYLQYSGTPILIQIVRSFLMSITSQAGLVPPVVIPMINITKLYENTENG
jgi:preprotein translocase subunit SecB